MLVAGFRSVVPVTTARGIRSPTSSITPSSATVRRVAKDPPGVHRAGLGVREAAGYEM